MERVLVLEREGTGGDSLEQILSSEGYQVLRARDVAQAARLLRSGPVHICVLEIHPTLVDVRDLLEKIRALHPKLPRILYVSPRDTEPVQHLFDYGDELLVRPVSRAHLAAVMLRYQVRAKLQAETDQLRQTLYGCEAAESLLLEPRGLREVMERAERIAADRGGVLIRGARGTGKTLMARYLHEKGPQNQGPMHVINCATLQGSLQESELFGHEPGAFPGATETVPGTIELTHGGTLILQEVSALSLDVQHRLHRFLQTGSLRRMGGQRSLNCRARVIATTSQNLQEEVASARFAPDLLRRLSVHVLPLPPLSERKQDIGILAKRFLREAPSFGTTRVLTISPEAISALTVYDWPGNVEELRGVINRTVLRGLGETVLPDHLALEAAGNRERALEQAVGMTVADMEREMILRTLEKTKGNRTAASKLLGLTTRTLSNKIRIYRAQGYHVIGGRKKRPMPVLQS
jgi:DNA-binding NtrC family response regulator